MIITDGSCDFFPEFLEKNGIRVVPLKIFFGDEEYLSTMDPDLFYEKMEKVPPKTSQPSPKMFLDAVMESEGPVKIVTISSKLSGTYNSAKAAASLARDMGRDVEVVDSLQASIGLGMYIRDMLEGVDGKITLFGMPETLEMLIRNGRIGKVAGFVAKMAGILPLIELKDGELVPVRKPSTRNPAEELHKEVLSRDPDTDEIIIAHARSGRAEELKERLSENWEVSVLEIGPLIASHLGRGALIVGYDEVIA